MKLHLIASSVLALASFGAIAQSTAASSVQRDVNQQTRIEQGLQSGTLTTREAAKLEKEQSRVDQLQAHDLKDGQLTPTESAKLTAAQNKASHDIAKAEHNNVNGNPQSASSQRMQADVQRDINQEKRIETGTQNGSLTNKEVSKLERGQARDDRKQAAAGADGHVSASEQHGIQRAQNHESRRIKHKKHNTPAS